MSKMAALVFEITELLEEGMRPTLISSILGIPLEMVYDVVADIQGEEVFDYDGAEF